MIAIHADPGDYFLETGQWLSLAELEQELDPLKRAEMSVINGFMSSQLRDWINKAVAEAEAYRPE